MRIFIIRHGDPHYPTDSLTETGRREAELLSERLKDEHIDKIYCSPLGRAKQTMAPTAKKTGLDFEILEWLREFPVSVNLPYDELGYAEDGRNKCPWDMYPQYWTRDERFYDNCGWQNHPIYSDGRAAERYKMITDGWNAVMAEFGYRRDGQIYHIEEGAKEDATVAFFCHLGSGLAVLSQLSRVSLPLMWHTFFMPTSSVTTVVMERHRTYIKEVHARILQVGDTSHIYAGGRSLSQSGLHSPIK